MAETDPPIFPELHDCWAKTDPDAGEPSISVISHCITVGAVAQSLLKSLSDSVRRKIPQGAQTLVAAHDVGKLTPGFQIKAPRWKFFDSISSALLRNTLCTNHSLMSQAHLVGRCQTPAAVNWLVSTGGHHGRYPLGFRTKVPKNRRCEGGVDGFGALRDELMEKLFELFGPLPEENADGERERIHLLTGFTIFADWIGSNNDWFPPDHPTGFDALRQTAEKCLERLRWGARIRSGASFGRLFQPDSPDSIQPRPIQTGLIQAADRPGLYIVEAPMGMGKTEAALAAAYRRWTEGDERGLYFALPTQLTSNRIHDRVHAFLRVATDSASIETLIHGSAWLKDGESRRIVRRHDKDEYNDSDEALRWFASTRKQLLAPFGTGTVDQALLAVLPAKFAALRYFALAGKVVVIDEVHSYDPYMSELVDRLVGYLIKAGSTVIVLSATLTAARRRELVEAAGAVEISQPEAYPLITKAATDEPEAEHIEIREKLEEKNVRIENRFEANESDAYWQEIAAIVESGANVVVIRNTVALAQETYLRLRSLLTGRTSADHVGLLHSRFPQNERDLRETRWTRLLGKGDADRPSGSLLVSTQIVEQSVDIDVDLLVTDLAPIDLILQRIGRLHRHRRSRPAVCATAICHVLHPLDDWSVSAKEIKQALTPHHYVYPAISLWQAAGFLTAHTTISIPGEIRRILETVHASSPEGPELAGVRELAEDARKKHIQQTGTAKTRDVFEAVAIEDREGRETRYGIRPIAQLVLLRSVPVETNRGTTMIFRDGETHEVRHGEFSFPLAKALHQRAARIPAYLVDTQIKAAPEWLATHIESGVLAVLPDAATELEFPHGKPSGFRLHYRADLGITFEKEAYAPAPTNEDDFWF